MTSNVGSILIVGDTIPWFTITIQQDNRIGDTKYYI
jgi:hypothetical protein